MLDLDVGSIRVARWRPYVYIGFSRVEHFAYIGQTFDRRGFIGRWTDHLSGRERSSFYCRLSEHDEAAFDRITDLRVLAWDLGDHPSFNTLETTHREAVEYLTQKAIWGFCHELDPWVRPISKVRTSLEAERDFVRLKAAEIISQFRALYESLESQT